nr:MAG TPA: hypothetical protein [Caudoviricetes sp.]
MSKMQFNLYRQNVQILRYVYHDTNWRANQR